MLTLDKPLSDWTETDIQSLIDQGIPESLTLDYKGSGIFDDKNKRSEKVSIAVSAFANSEGGIIVFGVSEKDQLPIAIDGGVNIQTISNEWLDNVITSTVRPRIDGLKIKQIPLSSHNGHAIYVVEIPQAIYNAPHQASDNRYYKRHNFKAQPMEDYEIRDVRRRSIGPDLHIHLTDISLDTQDGQSNETLYFNISVENHSDEPALYTHFDVYMDEDLQLFNFPTIDTFDPEPVKCQVYESETAITRDSMTMTRYSISWVTPDKPPIWKGLARKLYPTQEGMAAHPTPNSLEFIVVVAVSSPQMPVRTNVFKVKPWERLPARRVELRSEVVFSLSG